MIQNKIKYVPVFGKTTGYQMIPNKLLKCYPELSVTDKVLLCIIYNSLGFNNKKKHKICYSDCCCWDNQTLAEMLGVSVRTIQRSLSKLESFGIIKCSQHPNARRIKALVNFWEDQPWEKEDMEEGDTDDDDLEF